MRPLALLLIAVVPLPCATRSAAEEPSRFTISIDSDAWRRWGFQYPVTYVFEAGRLGDHPSVECRRGNAETWGPLPQRKAADRFNGVEAVRWNGKQAMVSVGFRDGPEIALRFQNAYEVRYLRPARFYDDRRAAYTLSNDNWGKNPTANPGAPFQGADHDASDKYQAAVHVCRHFGLPLSIAVNTGSAGGDAFWQRMQEELDRGDAAWEPAVHTRTHACSRAAYLAHGYGPEILGCRDDLLGRLSQIPFGQHIFEYILSCGYQDEEQSQVSAGQFLFLRTYNGHDNPESVAYGAWDPKWRFFKAGLETKSYDLVLERRRPKGRYHAADVAELNAAFDAARRQQGVFYAMWHSDRYQNSVIHDLREGIEGQQGSTLMQHFAHVAAQRDVWHVANGWLFSYRYVAENVQVTPFP